jgi:RNA polymerase sigma-70 factor, ECF subfamily
MQICYIGISYRDVRLYTGTHTEMDTRKQLQADTSRLTALLNRMQQGDRDAAEEAVGMVYGELHKIAANRMAHERPGQILQATALINEAYMRLMGAGPLPISNRRHFLALASEQMRRILVDHARSERAGKRGGDAVRVALDEKQAVGSEQSIDVLSLDEALKHFEQLDPRAAQVVALRYFGGHTEQEVAEILEVSLITVRRDWEFARSWLFTRLSCSSR